MKNYLILIFLTALVGCDAISKSPKKIISKAYSLEPKKKMLPCICMYEYTDFGTIRMFEDSCNRYHIGDTIK